MTPRTWSPAISGTPSHERVGVGRHDDRLDRKARGLLVQVVEQHRLAPLDDEDS
jgi:hypothetical protein